MLNPHQENIFLISWQWGLAGSVPKPQEGSVCDVVLSFAKLMDCCQSVDYSESAAQWLIMVDLPADLMEKVAFAAESFGLTGMPLGFCCLCCAAPID